MTPAERLRDAALAEGFDAVGFVSAEHLQGEESRLREWLAEGRHGDMAWLEKDPHRRCDPAELVDGARTVVVLTMSYLRESLPPIAERRPPAKGRGRISRYARSRDYHRVIEKRLRRLCRCIDTELCPGSLSRSYVDYGPILERPWAVRAGLGFVGKHTLVIDPKRGSFFFLAVIVTSAEITETPKPPITNSCGDCRRCIDACPTGAITEPYRLDARRCLSYLTIEKVGEVEEEFWDKYEGNIFGCDICQEVCPYNQARSQVVGDSPLGELLVPEDVSLAELIRDPEGFLSGLGDAASPLRRAGADSLRRNAILAGLGSDSDIAEALEKFLASGDGPKWLQQLALSAREHLKKDFT